MSTPQPIAPVIPRFRITPRTALTAVGVLVAIAATIMFLALTGANHHTTVAASPTTSQAASVTRQTRYLGPRQQQAPISSHGAASMAAGDPAAHPTCLGDPQRCLR